MNARISAILLLLLSAVGCGDDDGGVDFPAAQEGQTAVPDENDVYAINSRNGDVKLGLTEERVYFRLSDEQLAEIDREMGEDMDTEGDDLGAVIGSAVQAGVSRALRFRVSYDVDEIERIRFENGRIVFDLVSGREADIDVTVSDEEVTESFAEEDVRRFIEEFERVKAGG